MSKVPDKMIEAGMAALEVYAESPPRILVEEVLRAAFATLTNDGKAALLRMPPPPASLWSHIDG